MFINIVLGLFTVIALVVVIGAAFLASEEKQYRYDVSITDEHEV